MNPLSDTAAPDEPDPRGIQGARAPLGAVTRRGLGRVGALTGLTITGMSALPDGASATEIGPQTGSIRADAAQTLRVSAAQFQRTFALLDHPDNADEATYTADRRASYSKALPHDGNGVVSPSDYNAYRSALDSGQASSFEALSIGPRGLVDPLAAYAFSLEGADPHAFKVPPAPTYTSDQLQGEMAELYWMALARDVPFDTYATDGSGIVSAAVSDLNGFRSVQVPRGPDGKINAQTLFRDKLPGVTTGNYISQYLLQDIPYGAQRIAQNTRRRPTGDDRLTVFSDWLSVQNGTAVPPVSSTDFRYIRNGRDLAEYVHADFPAQAVLGAARIIAAQGSLGDGKFSPGINDPNNPYVPRQSDGGIKQFGFVTFGNQMFFDLVTRASQLALQAAWYQKWLVHRRGRPEEYGGRIETALRRGGNPSTIGDQLRASLADPARLGRVPARFNGSLLLPQAFPEGAPTHPAYPSGHSTYVGAGVTMIKAFVDGTKVVANPKRVADPNNGDTLVSTSDQLIINDELDKLVMNIGVGRLHAGVHWRSDHALGIRLGELVAIRALQDLARTYAEPFNGWTLRRFDGTTVTVTSDSVRLGSTATATTNEVFA